jgi:hypothetical protein
MDNNQTAMKKLFIISFVFFAIQAKSQTFVNSITGTTNQVKTNVSTGNVTLSLPQNVHTAATPAFAGMTLTSASTATTLGITKTAADSYIVLTGVAPSVRFLNDVTGTTANALIGVATQINNYTQGTVAGDQVIINTKGPIVLAANATARANPIDFKLTNNGNTMIGNGTENGSKLQVNGTFSVATLATATNTDFAVSVDALGNFHKTTNTIAANILNISGLTTNYIPKYSGNSVFGNSLLFDNGTSVGIGTITPSSNYKLAVEGMIGARKIKVTQVTPWADYVFNDDYKLQSLPDLELFIKANKHLPEVPSAEQVEKEGIDLGDNQALLLKKIEELTLYMIEMKKELNVLKKQNEQLLLKEKMQ